MPSNIVITRPQKGTWPLFNPFSYIYLELTGWPSDSDQNVSCPAQLDQIDLVPITVSQTVYHFRIPDMPWDGRDSPLFPELFSAFGHDEL